MNPTHYSEWIAVYGDDHHTDNARAKAYRESRRNLAELRRAYFCARKVAR